MSGTMPPIPPPPFGASSSNPSSPNGNWVDTMPTTNDPINTTNTKNESQKDFTSWKVRFMVFLDGFESYLLKTLEDGPFVPMSSLSTSENPLPKHQNQWSNAESCLANQDKRLKSIIISCLPNDVMKSVIKCKTAKEMWNDLILAHEGPSDTRDTMIAALRLKLNAFKSLEGEKVNGTFTRLKCLLNDLENNGVIIPQAKVNATFVNNLPRKWLSMNQTQRANNSIKNDYVEEDQRTSNKFMADLNAEYHERALLANQKSEKGLIAESFDWDEESVSSEDEKTTRIKAFMAIVEDEPSVEKANARYGQWVDITLKKALGGRGKKKEKISSKEVVFTKADESSSLSIPEITSDSESKCDTQEPLPPLLKLIGAAPTGTSGSLISLPDLTLNMTDLSLDTFVPELCLDKKDDSSTVQLLLTLMEEVKGLTKQIEIPSGTSPSNSQSSSKCEVCGSVLMNQLTVLRSTPTDYLKRYSKESGPKVVFRDDSSGDTEGYGLLCDANFKVLFTKTHRTIFNQNDKVVLIAPRRRHVYVIDMSSFNKESNACFFAKESLKMETLNKVKVKELRSDNGTEFINHKLEEFCDEKATRTMSNSAKLPKQFWGEAVNTACYTQNRSIIVKRNGKTAYDVFRGRSPDISYFYVFVCLVHIHNHRDHLGKFDEKADDGFFLGYSLVAKAFRVFNIRRQEMEETIHVTFSEDDEAISQSSTEGDAINFNENISFPDDEFLEPSVDDHPTLSDHNHLELADHLKSADNIDSAKCQDTVLSEPISDVQPSPIISPSAEGILQPPVPQDRWLREKHIELVNIIGEPLAEPKKLTEALEEEGWIIAMQEELTQFERNKVWTLVPKPHGKTIIGTKWIWKNKMDKNGVVIKNKERLVASGIFLAYAAYMDFMVYQMDMKSTLLNGNISKEVYVQQPLGFESSEFPNHVCKLDKALYGLKQAPRAWYQANPKESHIVGVKRIFRYLKGTPNLGLWYPKGSGFDLKAYSTSDYAGCKLDRKSTSGGCQILGGKLVCWNTKKQSSVAMSSAEAEYIAAAGCCVQVLWIKSQLADYDVLYDKVPIFYDNTSAISISNNPVLHSRTKHIDLMYHFIRDHILKGDIELHFVPIDLQLADIFTNHLSEPSFTRLVAALGMLNIEKQVPDKKKTLSDPLI
ncbi:retrovirus-related pol polyprotein from transposon TNT 1-94 [Tanacetum coccineum]